MSGEIAKMSSCRSLIDFPPAVRSDDAVANLSPGPGRPNCTDTIGRAPLCIREPDKVPNRRNSRRWLRSDLAWPPGWVAGCPEIRDAASGAVSQGWPLHGTVRSLGGVLGARLLSLLATSRTARQRSDRGDRLPIVRAVPHSLAVADGGF